MSTPPARLADALGLEPGATPFPWQTRLLERLLAGQTPEALDVPTGLGKTATIAIWLLARALGAPAPRRLIYVVDRRAVVDQATQVAIDLRQWLEAEAQSDLKVALGLEGRPLPISTLRGQHIDNREWLEDPSCPAVIVGTVDMVGSRLLFQGYGVSRKMRPYHAGLLGQDALIVLDEAHLVPPFEALIRQVTAREGALTGGSESAWLPPMRLLTLSATSRSVTSAALRMDDADHAHPEVRRRLDAVKRLEVQDVAAQRDLPELLAARAWELGTHDGAPQRVIVFVNRRQEAQRVFGLLDALARPKTKGKQATAEEQIGEVELLVGGRRVRDREQAAQRFTQLGFLAGGGGVSVARPTFLVATSAGEVGIDLDADHMVCDLVAWDRMIQRLGRVNRRGQGAAEVHVFARSPDAKAEERALASFRAQRDALAQLEAIGNAGPAAILTLSERAGESPELQACLDAALTPAPLHPPLEAPTVLDWAMTSWADHAGRPPVEPWLRGWTDEDPQCRLIWRAHEELPYVEDQAGETWANDLELRSFFEAAPPHASEVLETETWRAVAWLYDRAKATLKRERRESTEEDESSPRKRRGPEGPAALPAHHPCGALLGPDGTFVRLLLSSQDMSREGKPRRERLARELAGCTLVIDARLGGLDGSGLLSEKEDAYPATAPNGGAEGTEPWLEVPEGAPPVVRFRVRRGDPAEPLIDPNWRERLRLPRARSEGEGEVTEWLIVDKWRHDAATEEDRSAGNPQLLDEHSAWTEERATRIGKRIGLDASATRVLEIAGRLHDQGKRAPRWQRAFSAEEDGPYAKTRGPLHARLLEGYRHEFGSLPYAESDSKVAALTPEERDLVLHLIASHHGFARPLIRTEGCEDAPPSALEVRAQEVCERFFRLQERWGPWGLAWWEALLRAADQQASRANDEQKLEAVTHAR